jgi:hypothetical protein
VLLPDILTPVVLNPASDPEVCGEQQLCNVWLDHAIAQLLRWHLALIAF